MTGIAWTAFALAAIANVTAIWVIFRGSTVPTAAATRRMAYVCVVLVAMIAILSVAALVALIPWDFLSYSYLLDEDTIEKRVGSMVNTIFGGIGFVWLPGLGALVLWFPARKLDTKEAKEMEEKESAWPG